MLNPITYMICIPVAVLNTATRRRSLDLLIPIVSFVGLYSFLPHKEWRFIIYVIPGLTAIAAAGAAWIWTRRSKSIIYAVLSLSLVASVLISFATSTALLAISSLNYPGGEALHYLHNHMDHASGYHYDVFFDNLACQTGVTRFLENHHGSRTILDALEAQDPRAKRTWTYDKTEDPEELLNPNFWYKFEYVLAERPEKIIGSWSTEYLAYGYSGVKILKPGEKGGSPVVPLGSVPWEAEVDRRWPARVAVMWKRAEDMVRERFLRGWWLEIRMEPKIRLLMTERQPGDEL
jgi:alpha-1,6-mannosyltransferase